MVRMPKEEEFIFDILPFDKAHYDELKRRYIVRLLLTYIAPLLIIILFSYFQYRALDNESRKLHLKAIAENQSNTLNLFLMERIVNLRNLIDDPQIQIPPETGTLEKYLNKLIRNSESFVDIGFFDSAGVQTTYVGPYSFLEMRNYSFEDWYINLKQTPEDYIITDIYLGFRQRPHFTIAVNRIIKNQYVVLRATLDPGRIYDYMRSLEGAGEIDIYIVNREGDYQLVTPRIGTTMDASHFIPPIEPRLGTARTKFESETYSIAYSWLKTADWALIVQPSRSELRGIFTGFYLTITILSFIVVLITVLLIIHRSSQMVKMQMETDKTRAQLEHASKLASVGELAAGIAHEINNPLAVINEEAGLIKDLMNPEFGTPEEPDNLTGHLDIIQSSVFRCRDITHKLLRFVRKSDIKLKTYDLNKIIDEVVDGLLGAEMSVSNITIERRYADDLPQILTDRNQLQQVILNIINNSVDAFEGRAGTISFQTSIENECLAIAITDTGKGMASAQLKKIFMPFYTTKEVGKGTGLGLSVSYGIIKSLGGSIEVQSVHGMGSTFTIKLPVNVGK